jgi:protein-tyrosine phosphatase
MARGHGVDICGHRGRQVEAPDFWTFTHILALDRNNHADLRRLAPADAPARLGLLLDVVPDRAGDAVADPYFGDEAGFETTWNDVGAAAEALAAMFKG